MFWIVAGLFAVWGIACLFFGTWLGYRFADDDGFDDAYHAGYVAGQEAGLIAERYGKKHIADV